MWYKRCSTIGIRRKFGDGLTAFSFGGRHCGLSEDVLRGFGYMVLKKLDGGMKEEDVKAWAKEAVKG